MNKSTREIVLFPCVLVDTAKKKNILAATFTYFFITLKIVLVRFIKDYLRTSLNLGMQYLTFFSISDAQSNIVSKTGYL